MGPSQTSVSTHASVHLSLQFWGTQTSHQLSTLCSSVGMHRPAIRQPWHPAVSVPASGAPPSASPASAKVASSESKKVWQPPKRSHNPSITPALCTKSRHVVAHHLPSTTESKG